MLLELFRSLSSKSLKDRPLCDLDLSLSTRILGELGIELSTIKTSLELSPNLISKAIVSYVGSFMLKKGVDIAKDHL